MITRRFAVNISKTSVSSKQVGAGTDDPYGVSNDGWDALEWILTTGFPIDFQVKFGYQF